MSTRRTVALLLCTLAWTMSMEPQLRRVAYLVGAGFDSPWPLLFDHPALALVAWLVGLGGLLAAQLDRTRPAGLIAWLGATLFLAIHRVTSDDATFFGGIWVAAWITWFLRAQAADPERAATLGPRVATFVAAALFFPAGTGKLVGPYFSGEAFTALMGGEVPLVFQLIGVEPPGWFSVALGRAGALVELSSPSWLVLPVRWSLGVLGATCVGMMLLWTVHLGSILLQVLAMALLAWPTSSRSP